MSGLILLREPLGLTGYLRIGNQTEGSEYADNDDVSEKCENTLKEYLVGGFSLNQYVKYWSYKDPGCGICSDLDYVEEYDGLGGYESAFLNGEF